MNKTTKLFFLFFLISSFVLAQVVVNIEKHLDNVVVYKIFDDGEFIWAAGYGSGIFRYSKKNNSWTEYNSSNSGIKNDFVYCITANEQYVWAGSIDGLFILDKKTNKWTSRKFSAGGQLGNWIRSVAYDKYANAVWIGRFMNLTKYDIKTKKYIDYDLTVGGNEKTNTIATVFVQDENFVWFGTEAGLHKYDKRKDIKAKNAITFYNTKSNHFNGEGDFVSISAMLFERNYVWIGVDEFITPQKKNYNVGGLYQFDNKNNWRRFDKVNGFPANGIYCIERTGNYLWVALYQFGIDTKEIYGKGLVLINRITYKVQTIDNENIPSTINNMYYDGQKMWLCSDKGILTIELYNPIATWSKG
ncbi:MAG: hypothetical protein JW866_08350 [Ignavibacteriales bacterium]|nr:hypothetical protein [Ignavibacteriales bacterium]